MSDAKPQSEPSMEEILASINRIIADDKKPGDASPHSAGEPNNEVLELTEAIAEDGTIRRIEPVPPRLATPELPAPTAEPKLESPRLDLPQLDPPRLDPPRLDPPKLDPGVRDHVLSAAAAGAAAAALGRLAATPPPENPPEEPERGGSGNTLEDLVRDALRPLLRSWLDANLPALAEKLAREEIARILRDAGLR